MHLTKPRVREKMWMLQTRSRKFDFDGIAGVAEFVIRNADI